MMQTMLVSAAILSLLSVSASASERMCKAIDRDGNVLASVTAPTGYNANTCSEVKLPGMPVTMAMLDQRIAEATAAYKACGKKKKRPEGQTKEQCQTAQNEKRMRAEWQRGALSNSQLAICITTDSFVSRGGSAYFKKHISSEAGYSDTVTQRFGLDGSFGKVAVSLLGETPVDWSKIHPESGEPEAPHATDEKDAELFMTCEDAPATSTQP